MQICKKQKKNLQQMWQQNHDKTDIFQHSTKQKIKTRRSSSVAMLQECICLAQSKIKTREKSVQDNRVKMLLGHSYSPS